jgi:hypothetical protein
MAKTESGREPRLSRPLNCKLTWWRQNTTATNHQSTKSIASGLRAPTCGHRPPHTRHVETPDGPARYLCRRCTLAALAAEAQTATRAIVRAQLDALFAGCRPRITRSGGDIAPPTSTLARSFANFAEAERRAICELATS